ncbi:bifunctional thymidylate/uridylate kinase KNAG_0A04670 [Huiozyma naganishii CBS 8797]|uniref:dTMP kinase n=1 Tax=Huiozyma naganishii (strain ATCC MYA-139 / BCRC 22969 / CBS 8797 / KCTC 17520 / NBRC 10181 / NCYC 3082 / Yp74L-3) TaxID=1071383 RepID=J7S2E9_HUIN7|nr:hypothetical protein KNAG_0A04670 [Kazachstania naganishii CBS 8797]CCK68139.1 hypothetical protein KNAG_0A04670 [Kazachstania naganishii CBS 8797]
MGRGQLILIEGLDRTGKTTQTELLLNNLSPNAELIKFPQRQTPIGKIIDRYLTDKSYELPDQAIHLLFSANRWELIDSIKSTLDSGKHVILDRYVFSGVAYSVGKNIPGMDIHWCVSPDKGLMRPDLTLFLVNEMGSDSRAGFGEERYESVGMQQKVRKQFDLVLKELGDATVKTLNVTGKTIDEVELMIRRQVDNLLSNPNEEYHHF